MQARLELRSEQRLALQPDMLRSIEILQLAADDLCALIEREVESNETLLACRRPGRGDRARGGDAGFDAAALAAAPPPDLRAWLQLQLAWRQCPDALTAKVLALADLLDERGLLPQSDAELIAALGEELWLDALAMMQTLEPRGLGARTGVEAMLLQLDPADPDRDDIAVLMTEHLDALARNKLPQVAAVLGLEVDAIVRLVAKAKQLNPRPASALTTAVVPLPRIELDARLQDGHVVVRLAGGDLPELRVSRRYVALARSKDLAVRRYLQPKLAAARDLIRAVDLRRRTLVRVAAAIMQRQVSFLQHGVRQMGALRMAQIAEELDCHTSTVSRAIAGKWVATAHGAFPLRVFFDGAHLGSPAGGAPVAGALASRAGGELGQRGVRERIRELIAAEDPVHPLSDGQMVVRLRSDGVVVARRTVAKYRSELGLPSQWQRRAHCR